MFVIFKQELVVQNETGLHARPASDLTVLCQKFNSEIRIITGDVIINPKSIISILTGGINKGTSLVLEVEGEDEETAGNAIVEFITNLKD